MKSLNNIVLFINNNTVEKLEKEKLVLIPFTKIKGLNQRLYGLFHNIKHNNGIYTFSYNNKQYEFRLLSDLDLVKYDKKTLRSAQREQRYLNRLLKLINSLKLTNPKLLVGKSKSNKLDVIIEYYDKEEYIISYEYNLIMKKQDYIELFNFEQIEELNKQEIYFIYQIVKELNPTLLPYLIIFKDQILKELGKTNIFDYLTQKYDKIGINKGNYTMIGDGSDIAFFETPDMQQYSSQKFINELSNFTENPIKKKKHIKRISQYEYQYKDFKRNFKFKLLSDSLDKSELQEELLSENRYHKCHMMSVVIANIVQKSLNKKTLVVSGYNNYNNIDKICHSWVEIEELNLVIDYVLNIIINKDEYYKIVGAEPLEKTPIDEYIANFEYVKGLGQMGCIVMNYFGNDIVKDLKKNKQLFKTKND